MIDDLLMSPVLTRVLCQLTNFSFSRDIILAEIDRAEFGDFDVLVLGLLLMSHFKGQIVVPDYGFYGREAHASLIRETALCRRLLPGRTVAQAPASYSADERQGSRRHHGRGRRDPG